MCRERCPGIDVKWYINKFMRSEIRRRLDEGDFWWANVPPGGLVTRYIRDEYSKKRIVTDYVRGEDWGGINRIWIGRVYAYYQWFYNVSSESLIEKLPLETMERLYETLHECGDQTSARIIHDEILN
jgi:hypothetical protein